MLSLTAEQRDELLTIYRKDPDPELRFRAHIILLLADGHPWDTIEAMLFCSSRTVDRWLKRFQAEGVAGLTGRKRGRPFRLGLGWVAVLVAWVTTKTPGDFGFLRSRWSCAVLALLAPRAGGGGGQPRDRPPPAPPGGPGLPAAPADPPAERGAEAGQAGRAAGAPGRAARRRDGGLAGRGRGPHQPQDRPDVDAQGKQATVQTPGTNKKRHLAGSIHWRTGQVFVTEAGPQAGARQRPVHQAPGRPPAAAAAVQEGPRDLRQRGVPHQPRGDRVPLEARGPDRGPPAAQLLPGLQPDRAGVVAPAREHHAEPSVSGTWGNYWTRCSPGWSEKTRSRSRVPSTRRRRPPDLLSPLQAFI